MNEQVEYQIKLAAWKAEKEQYETKLAAWTEKRDEYNRRATEATGLKHGDKVEYHAIGFGGFISEQVVGKIIHDKNGYLVARFKGHGNRNLNKGMKRID